MKITVQPTEEHIIKKFDVHYVSNNEQPHEQFRNCWAIHHPKDKPVDNRAVLFKLTNPRISSCGNYFEEDAAALENPHKKLGIMRRPLTHNQKMNLVSQQMKNELAKSLFGDIKSKHTVFLKY